MGTDFNNRDDKVRVAGWLLQESEGLDLPKLDDFQLRDIPQEIYKEHKDSLLDRFRKRAAHSYSEQERVKLGAETWSRRELEAFGQLMFESGHNSFYQKESGIPEMETIFNILRETEGLYGARPSGEGYRGEVIGLINPEYKMLIKERIVEVYPVKHPEYKDVYEVNFCRADDGARYVNPKEFIQE